MGRSIWMGLEAFVGSLKTHLLIYNERKYNSTITTYLRSTNLLRSNTPPSSGKLVLNTPFLDAGVPASKETRRIYGTSAGGRRIYWVKFVNVAVTILSWGQDKPLDSCSGHHQALMVAHTHKWEFHRALSPTRRSLFPHLRESWES